MKYFRANKEKKIKFKNQKRSDKKSPWIYLGLLWFLVSQNIISCYIDMLSTSIHLKVRSQSFTCNPLTRNIFFKVFPISNPIWHLRRFNVARQQEKNCFRFKHCAIRVGTCWCWSLIEIQLRLFFGTKIIIEKISSFVIPKRKSPKWFFGERLNILMCFFWKHLNGLYKAK